MKLQRYHPPRKTFNDINENLKKKNSSEMGYKDRVRIYAWIVHLLFIRKFSFSFKKICTFILIKMLLFNNYLSYPCQVFLQKKSSKVEARNLFSFILR